MNACDVMTTKVVAVGPDTSTNKIAETENRISAVPVVGGTGAPIAMVREGDLIGREEAARDDWWLALLADGAELNADHLASLRARTAREITSAPVVTVSEGTDISEIARLLAAYRIKRVPVVRAGRVIGIVSRADLLRGLAQGPAAPNTGPTGHPIFDWLDKQFPPAQQNSPRTALTEQRGSGNQPADLHLSLGKETNL